MEANYFTILYWFCHTSTWIRNRCTCVPHPEPSSHLPSGTIPLGHPSAPAPSILYHALILDWWFISYMILYISMPFSQIIPPSPSPTESKRVFYTSVSLLLSRRQGYRYHLSKFHIYALVYCIGVFLSGLLHPGGSEVKASAWNAGDAGSIPGSGRSPGEGNGNSLQYSCLENPMEGGAW